MKNKEISLIGFILLAVIIFGIGSCQTLREQTLTPAATMSSIRIDELPGPPPVIKAGADDVFVIVWFELPYSGEFNKLLLSTDNQVNLWRVIVNWATQGVNRGRLSQEERQRVQEVLGAMANNAPSEQSEGPTIITVSFPWESEIRLMSFSGSACPSELLQLYEIVDTVFSREGKVSEWIPCKD